MRSNTICPHCNFDNDNHVSGANFNFHTSLIKEFYVCEKCKKSFNHFYANEFWIEPKFRLKQFHTYIYFKRN